MAGCIWFSPPERGLHVEEANERGAALAVGGGHGVCLQEAEEEERRRRERDASACTRRHRASTLATVQEERE